jgi:glycosyltransferase involved in cell wall biosynthesis
MGIVAGLFVFCFLFQHALQLRFILAIISSGKKNLPDDNDSERPVSIVICAKNEADNLSRNLPFMLRQEYKNFELLIVDDGSEDATRDTVTRFASADKRVRLIAIPGNEKAGSGKKYALQTGVRHALHDIVLLTDADCRPVSEKWILRMTKKIGGETKIVLGISPYAKDDTVLNALVEYETAMTAMQYLGGALLRHPYMSVGRNVCYEKALLVSKRWTSREFSIASGDDDLAIQSLAKESNTDVCMARESYTISEAPKTWRLWMRQKLRHYEAGKLYHAYAKIMTGMFAGCKLLFYLLGILLLCKGSWFSVCLLIAHFAITVAIHFLLQVRLQLNARWYFSPLYDVLYIFFTVILGWMSRFNTARWK